MTDIIRCKAILDTLIETEDGERVIIKAGTFLLVAKENLRETTEH